MLANITIVTSHSNLLPQIKKNIAYDLSDDNNENYSSTLNNDSDRNVMSSFKESFPGSAAPPIHVVIMLLGIGIVGFASLQR
jgi:hypothetical protein